MKSFRFFFGGFAAGLAALALCLLLGLDVEQSSYLQLYNFNEAASSGLGMVRTIIERSGDKSEGVSGFMDEYKMDGDSGAGWAVPMKCRLLEDRDCGSIDESGHIVMLFMWHGRPFGVLTLGKGYLPRLSIVRSFGLQA